MAVLIVLTFSNGVFAIEVKTEEMTQAKQFVAEKFGGEQQREILLPFSFVYGGQSSTELLKKWQFKREDTAVDKNRIQQTLTYSDTNTLLTVRCVAVEYLDFPTVEWTVYFKNGGANDTPILEKICSLDMNLSREDKASEFVLHHYKGSQAEISDFQPFKTVLVPKSDTKISPFGGRPTNGNMSYFNLEQPGEVVKKVQSKTAIYENVVTEQMPGKGMIIAVGWPGQWAAAFTRNEGTGLHIQAGQETTHFILHSGEEVRTPLMAVQFWNGDVTRAQNIWRQWMFAHNMPRSEGKVPPPLLTPCSSHQFSEMEKANEENQKLFVSRYVEEGLAPDYWWMDAGWYKLLKGKWVDTGTWEIDPNRFPHGFRPISDLAHSKGVKIIVWFEPERVCEGTWLWEKHPEWLLSPKEVPDSVGWMRQWKIFNLGNPDARKWLTDHVDKLITEQGIDLYRQDFNVDPLWFWRSGDSPDRQGITENFYVQGYLAYWDELQRRHPGMLIDSCASGGRRNDIETLRRAVPFIQSDYIFEEVGQQSQNYIMSMWIPYHGTGTKEITPYHFWSTMAPHVTPCWDMRDKALDYGKLRTWLKQWRQIGRYYYGDFYPLTPYSLEKDVWIAWQFNSPDGSGGMIQAFRRPDSYTRTAQFSLQGLNADVSYEITDLQTGIKQTFKGSVLTKEGLAVTIQERSGVAVLEYKKLR
ncbi:MAG: alpha-galactosidase [Sedimentisphaerales bacterium]|nr:alpha-galactosidase [Sedimentisphaerales bacterium]